MEEQHGFKLITNIKRHGRAERSIKAVGPLFGKGDLHSPLEKVFPLDREGGAG